MNLWRLRTGTQWGLGSLSVLLLALALALGAMAMAHLDRTDLKAQQRSTQWVQRAAQTGELRLQLDRLRRLEAGLVGARSAAEAQTYTGQVAEQLQHFRALEERYASLLEGSDERMRFEAYSASRKAYLQWQQIILEQARAVDFRSAESMALTGAALVQTYAGNSQGSFAAAAAALEQWQQNHAAAARQAAARARQLTARTRAWMLWALGGASLALALALGWWLLRARNRAGARSAGQGRVPFFSPDTAQRQDQGCMGLCGLCRGTWTPLQQCQSVQQSDWLNLESGALHPSGDSRRPAAPAPGFMARKTRVTAEDWDSF